MHIDKLVLSMRGVLNKRRDQDAMRLPTAAGRSRVESRRKNELTPSFPSFSALARLLLLSVIGFLLMGDNRVTPSSAIAAPSEMQTGGDASPITEAELLAAIRAVRDADSEHSDEARRILAQLSDGQPRPANATTLKVETLADFGGRYVYDVLDTILMIPLAGGKELRIPVSKRFVSSRTLLQEIARLEGTLANSPAVPGRYRLEDRIKELKARAKSFDKEK
jgi:hypothetical protein